MTASHPLRYHSGRVPQTQDSLIVTGQPAGQPVDHFADRSVGQPADLPVWDDTAGLFWMEMFEQLPVPTVITNMSGTVLFANAALAELLGVAQSHLAGVHVTSFYGPGQVNVFADEGSWWVAGGSAIRTYERLLLSAEGMISVRIAGRTAHTSSGSVVIASVCPVAWDARTQADLMLDVEFHRSVLAKAPDMIVVHNVDSGHVVWESDPPVTYPVGLGAGSDAGSWKRVTSLDREVIRQGISEVREVGDGCVIELRLSCPSVNGIRWLSHQMTPFRRNSHGLVVEYLSVTRDITDAVSNEQEMTQQALHDDLTGLPNRRLLMDRLAQSVDRSVRAGNVAVLMCDLDGFKAVNDRYGHAAGDAVLREVAVRIGHAIRPGDTAGRFGGDEFVVLVGVAPGEDPKVVTEMVAGRIEGAVVDEPIWFDGQAHLVGVSIGIGLQEPADTPESLLSRADKAMYRAKTTGRTSLTDRTSGLPHAGCVTS